MFSKYCSILVLSCSLSLWWVGGFLVITVSHPTFCCVGVGLWLRWGWAVTIWSFSLKNAIADPKFTTKKLDIAQYIHYLKTETLNFTLCITHRHIRLSQHYLFSLVSKEKYAASEPFNPTIDKNGRKFFMVDCLPKLANDAN